MRALIARTNAAWLIEKSGHLSPKASAEAKTLQSNHGRVTRPSVQGTGSGSTEP
jgi:hypothetical protein